MVSRCGGRLARLLVAILLLVPAAAAAQDEAVRFERAFERIDQFVAQHMEQNRTPGLALAVTNRQGLLHVASYGFADHKTHQPVTPDTLFEIGSITKSFTAISLLQLREEGKFDPQAPLNKYLPWLKVQTKYDPLTGHHLLTHSAGILHNRNDVDYGPYVVYALREHQTGYPPGKRFSYSNLGYEVLSYLLEQLEGKSYEEIVRRRIFAPLGMTSSSPAITNEIHDRLAVGYIPLYDDRPPSRSMPLIEGPWFEYRGGDGCVVATASDLAAYLRMLLNHGAVPQGRVLSEESFVLLLQPAVPMNVSWEKENTFYGYGLWTRQEDGHKLVGHGGSMIGYTSQMIGDLDDGVGVVVFVNGESDDNPDRVAEFALKVVRAALHNQELPAVPPLDPPTRVEKAAEYAGTYTSPEGKTLTLVAERERLLLLRGEQRIALARRGEDSFYVDHPDFLLFLLRFERDKGRKVMEASYGSDWYAGAGYTGSREFPVPNAWKSYVGHYRATSDPSNFRVLLRKGKLWMSSWGDEVEYGLVELEPGLFQIGKEETAERLRFDSVVEGKALRAEFSGVSYHRVSP